MKKKFISKLLASVMIISILAAPITTFAATTTSVQAMIDKAYTDQTFYAYNAAYTEILKLPKNQQTSLMEQLAKLQATVWNDDIAKCIQLLNKIPTTGSGKIYDTIEATINSSNINAVDKAYLLGELTGWGRKLVFTEDYTKALGDLTKAWTTKTSADAASAEASINSIQNTYNKEYLMESLHTLKFKISNVSGEPVYTWDDVYAKLKQAGVKPQFYPETFLLADGTYTEGIDYETEDHVFNVIDIHNLRSTRMPYMDMRIILQRNADALTPQSSESLYNSANAVGTIFEAIFPGYSRELREKILQVDYRIIRTEDRMGYRLPTVIFFGGRRIFVHKIVDDMYEIDISAVGDNSDIWEEVTSEYNGTSVGVFEPYNPGFTREQIKAYMPELADY
jgi:hypothetical protein